MIEQYLTSYEIAERLTEWGVLTRGDQVPAFKKITGRGKWRASTVRKMLTNPLYKGEYYYGKTRRVKRPKLERKPDGSSYKTRYKTVPVPREKWIKVEVPAIVDEATWEAAQARLAENKRDASRNTKREYLLRGMIHCPCGRRLSGQYRPDVDRGYYRCTAASYERWSRPCEHQFNLRQDRVEAAVWDAVVDYLHNPERFMLDVERRHEERAGEIARAQRKAKAADAALANIDRKLSQLLDQQLDGYPGEILDQKRKELLADREQQIRDRDHYARLQREVEVTPDTEAMLREIAATFEAVLPVMTFEDKRHWLQLLQLRVDVVSRDEVQLSGLLSRSIVVPISV